MPQLGEQVYLDRLDLLTANSLLIIKLGFSLCFVGSGLKYRFNVGV